MKKNKVLALLACGAIVLSACGQSTNDTTSEETSSTALILQALHNINNLISFRIR